MTTSLILGGVKSGKSRLAEHYAKNTGLSVYYIATAQAGDEEMQKRIQYHQQSRPSDWITIEEPIKLSATIKKYCLKNQCVLVDCLTLWLTNLLLSDNEAVISSEIDALLTSLKQTEGELILVSNETNMGIVPLGELSRRYCDEIGLLHQRIAQVSDNVILTIAGLPHSLKGQLA